MYDFATALMTLVRVPFFLAAYLVARLACLRKNLRSRASDPGLVRLSLTKLMRLSPEVFGSIWDPVAWLDRVAGERAIRCLVVSDQLVHGDSRAAVVVSVSPLLVAAYTDELDCIAMLRFPDELTGEYGLQVRSRLLTVNCYFLGRAMAGDLENGPLSYNRYSNFRPFIADFLSDDYERIRQRKARIREDEWSRTWVLGQRYLSNFGHQARDGSPFLCAHPAELVGSSGSD